MLKKIKEILIDGDGLLYTACYAAKDDSSPELAFHNMLNSILRRFDGVPHTVVLSNVLKSVNHRYKLSKDYKANRPPRPEAYPKLRKYVEDFVDKVVITDFGEADDWLSVNQTESTCIITRDKDLRTLDKGFVFDPVSKHLYSLSDPGVLWLKIVTQKDGKKRNKLEGIGFIFYCSQAILGDRADNIASPRGFGDTYAYKYLSKIKTRAAAWRFIYQFYCAYSTRTEFKKNLRLLWMMRADMKTYPPEMERLLTSEER